MPVVSIQSMSIPSVDWKSIVVPFIFILVEVFVPISMPLVPSNINSSPEVIFISDELELPIVIVLSPLLPILIL